MSWKWWPSATAVPRERIYLQERHVCQAFQEAIFAAVPAADRIEKLSCAFGLTAPPKFGPEEAVKIQNEIRAQLMKAGKPAYVAETFVNFEQAYRLILELGWHPGLPDPGRWHQPYLPVRAACRQAGCRHQGPGDSNALSLSDSQHTGSAHPVCSAPCARPALW